jgi:outer membrane protein
MINRRLGVALFLTVFLPGPTSYGANLLDVYRQAEEFDTVYRSAGFQRQVATHQTSINQSVFKPAVNLSSNIGLQRDDISGTGSDTYSSGSISVSLTQTLFDVRSRIAVTQAELSDQRAGLNFEAVGDDLILRVATSYFAVLGAIDNLDLARSEKIAIKRQLELAQERLNVGIGTQTDLYDAQARFQIVEANEIVAMNLIEDSRQALIAIVGSEPGELSKLRDDAPLESPTPDQVSVWVADALKNNPALLAENIGLDIARQEIERQRRIKSPNVSLNISQSYSDSNGGVSSSGSDRSVTSIGVNVAMPLYTGGSDKALVLQAALNANVQEQSVEQVRRQIIRDVRNLFNDVQSGIRRVAALQQAVVAGESAVEAKNEGFAAGLITNLDVLDAQRDLFQAERDYLRARYDYILAVLFLEQAAGQLDEDDVSRVNLWLQ